LEGSPSPYPEILPPPLSGKFGKIRKEVWEMWQELEGRGIEWDLLYDPIGWMAVLNSGISDIVYLNQGGWTGNLTLLPRYLAKFGKSRS
jgi:1-aminocyclopropane-1-carboxylate deaminase/D-cysteine desulfhydrase-like pyridoxal-dependent ACC family enzyme